MKRFLLILLSGLCALQAPAQVIDNGGFERGPEGEAGMPVSWSARPVPGYTVAPDNRKAYSGETSLRITAPAGTPADSTASFSQTLPVAVPKLQWMVLTARVRTENVTGTGNLWYQVLDASGKRIGSGNLEAQDIVLQGSSDWTRYALRIAVSPVYARLVIGGSLKGAGTIWYDDFSLETPPAGERKGPSKEAAGYLRRFRERVKTQSIHSDALPWDSLDAEIDGLAASATGYADATAIGQYLIARLRILGDNHSGILSRQRTDRYTRTNIDTRRPSVRRLGAHTGCVYMPGMRSINKDSLAAFATSLQNEIRALDASGDITGWVVDLRDCNGGNMYPMIAGLGPIVGEGDAGYFVKKDWRESWFYEGGRCASGKGDPGVRVKEPYTLRHPEARVAVLISGNTGSSGEMTALSFAGRPGARLFGQPTYGLTTSNGWYPMPDGSTLLLANAYTADRTGRIYKGSIPPDEALAADADALAAAERWLQE